MLALVIVTALSFDFTNGFHDTGNAMATSIASGALKPKTAVGLSAILNLVGAFLSVKVALTVATNVVSFQDPKTGVPNIDGSLVLSLVFAGLVGAILWNVVTWLLGLPSSSSHALFGGLIGATIAAIGWHHVKWEGILQAVVLPAILSPLIAGFVSAIGTWLVYAITRQVPDSARQRGFRIGQLGSASLVSLAHGTGDAQKTMGVITLALFVSGYVTLENGQPQVPFWVKFACASAIALGTYTGGWRIIRTLGKGLVEIESPQGMAAESAAAATILTASHFGLALSTTHVATGAILGTGIGKRGAEVRWGVAGRMVLAWFITLPASGVVGWICCSIAQLVPGVGGSLIIFALLIISCGWMWWRSRKDAVNPDNVNAEWDGETPNPADPEKTKETASV